MSSSSRCFTYTAQPMRVVFGAGASTRLVEELDALRLSRVLVLCSPEQSTLAEHIAATLGERSVGVHPGAVMHVPAEAAVLAGKLAGELGAGACVAVGGGSVTGLGKILALRQGLPVLAVPTTYAGSEMTPVWGLTVDGVKSTGRDRSVLPRAVVYDPELTHSLPVPLSVCSGLNAVAHAVEGLWAPDCSPVLSLMAAEGARSMLSALPRIVADPADPGARADALRGAWLCGAVLGGTTMSLHHKLCHVLGGGFDLPHAAVHAVMLPHVLAYNGVCAPEALTVVASALSAVPSSDGTPPENVAGCLWDLAGTLGAPLSLAALGFPVEAVDDVVRAVLAAPYANPREVGADDLGSLLRDAVAGRRPGPR